MVGIFFIIKDGVDLQKTTALLTETDDPRLTEASEKRKKWLAVVSSRTRGLKWMLIYKLLGQNPHRFPYAVNDGLGNVKQCCGDKTYNPFTFTCCDNQVMEIGTC